MVFHRSRKAASRKGFVSSSLTSSAKISQKYIFVEKAEIPCYF